MKRLRKCLLCHKKLGLVKFKTADGYICKYCYRISSLDYTKTVTSMTLADLKQVVQQAPQEKMITDSANFMITRRINGYVLFDDQHELLCLPNNRRFSAVNLKPEYFPYDSIEVVQTLNDEIVVKGKHLCTVQVKIVFSKPRETTRSIVLIPKPIEVQANVYHTMLNLAEQITSQLRTLATVKDSN